MADTPPNPELPRALGQLMRGLTALFWGLPAALIIGVNIGLKNRFELRLYDLLFPVAATGLLLFGTTLLSAFHPQERIWMQAVNRSRALAMVLVGLSPFLYWRVLLPEAPAYAAATWFLAVFGVLFLFHLNFLLQRLAAMLPDAALRQETMTFTTLNHYLLAAIPLLLVLVHGALPLLRYQGLAPGLTRFLQQAGRAEEWVFLLLTLVPIAMTMAMLWKIKEVVFHTIIGPRA